MLATCAARAVAVQPITNRGSAEQYEGAACRLIATMDLSSCKCGTEGLVPTAAHVVDGGSALARLEANIALRHAETVAVEQVRPCFKGPHFSVRVVVHGLRLGWSDGENLQVYFRPVKASVESEMLSLSLSPNRRSCGSRPPLQEILEPDSCDGT